jgi:hypothetical protein
VNDLRYDPNDPEDAHAADSREATQYDLPAVTPTPAGAPPAGKRDCTVWTAAVEQRLARLEKTAERLADTLQVLLLRLDDGK